MQRITKLVAIAVATLVLTMTLGACGSSSKSGGGSSAGTITISNFKFSPDPLSAKVGDTITVKNTDSTDHTVTALDGSFDTGHIPGGKTATFKVSKAGTIKFHCNIHNYMTGSILTG